MHIHQIVIDNFKSFADKTVIPFEKGFTTISGPNGSGKSNIIDSILFCLGLSTSRTIRADKLGDLVNNLSKRKEAIVTITFRKDADDIARQTRLALEKAASPEDTTIEDAELAKLVMEGEQPSEGEAPLEAKEVSLADLDINGEFVQVSRRIKAGSQAYNSTYYLNGRPTTLTEIHEYLGNFNISPGCYNVMMQGDVASIVNMSAMERRKIIDEIAGVAEFDRKIEQAERELEATAANIERNTILLSEIDARMEQLSAERDHALKYQKLRDEKHQYESMLLSAKYLDIKKGLEATRQNLAQAQQHKQKSKEQVNRLISEIAVTREKLLELSNEVKRKGEDQQIALKKQIEGLKGHIARKEDAIASIDEKTAENNKRIEQMHVDIKRQQQNIENIDNEIAGFEHQLKELQGLFTTESQNYEQLNKQFDALTGSGSELTVKRSEVMRKLTGAEDELSRINRSKLDVEAEIKRNAYEKELRLRNNSESAEKQQTLTKRQADLNSAFNNADMEKSAFEAQLKKLQLDYSQTRVDLNTAATTFNQVSREHMQLEARQKAYEEVSFSRQVETVLNANIPGVHGTLAQLGDVDGEFALAMEIAMGGRVQNIVVDNEAVAEEGIHLLQTRKAGRATFLPLTKIQPVRRLPPLPNNSGVIDYAINLIDFDPEYEAVFAYALGDTLIVEDMNAARPLMRQYRMVTLDGSLLEKSGAMTGGSVQQGRGGASRYFGGGSGLENELNTLLKKLEKAEIDKESLQKKLTSLEVKMDSVKTEYGQCMTLHSRLSAELAAVTGQLEELKAAESSAVDVSDLEKQVGELTKQLAGLDKEFSKHETSAKAFRAELDAIESQLPSDQIEQIRTEMSEVKFQMDYYDSQMRNVQADIKGKQMERNYQDVGIKDCNDRIAQAKQQNEDMVKGRKDAQEEIQLTMMQIKELEAQTTELDEELKKLQEERDQVQAQLIEQEKNKNIAEREITQLEEQIAAFQSRKRELEPQLAAVGAELLQAGIEPTSLNAENLPSEEEISGNIAKLTRRMEAMEPVNMLAIEEFDRVNERRSELAEKIQTLESEKETITVRIAGYQELKLASFMKAFESVDNNFQNIFAELSDGIGQLVLTNPEDPFAGGLTIHAQPRGKKMQRIEALSGGEKSLTSLAFVFSLQRYMPAPFYALDEVDQNLDGINAEKLANMVQRESGKGAQFIVVSLRKPMIEHSERTIGVTQRQNGITKVTGIKHRENEIEEINETDDERQKRSA